MSSEKRCPECGEALSGDALTGGSCPACMMHRALEGIGLGDSDELEPTVDLPAAGDPERIGAYRTVRRLGEGGMGVVFLAEQSGEIERQVALKVVRVGINTRQVLARFQLERQSLAMMDHPHIAKIFDAGCTESGQPYFVMEYVDGSPINEYCDERRLTTEQRLRLFQQVCGAVQHAHHKGVIHRDIKPSNILVRDGEDGPEPKMIDFGIAKATESRLAPATLFTELGRLIGTPQYMSPEQADTSELDIDTRTDVYSLGVVLYELLVGVTPHDPRELVGIGIDALLQAVRQANVPTPSSRLRTMHRTRRETAEKRSTDPVSLSRKLRGELDWIVMRAVEKDRNRRYGTASDLRQDIERYLRNEPVVAGPPGAAYRLTKFVKRNRLAVVSAGVVVSGLLAATIGVSVGMIQARRAEREARQQASIAEATNRFLHEDLLSSVAPELQGRDVKVREILDGAGELVEKRFADDPLTRAAIHTTVGKTYARLGELETARTHIEAAWEIRRKELGELHEDSASSRSDHGALVAMLGDLERGERLLAEALDALRRTAGPDAEATLLGQRQLASVLVWQGRFDEAEPLFTDALERARRVLGNDHLETITLVNDYGLLLSRKDQPQLAEPYLVEAVEGFRELRGERSADALVAASNLAACYLKQGDYAEAVPRYEQLADDYRDVFGEEHPKLMTALGNLASVYRRVGRLEESRSLLEEVVQRRSEQLGPQHRLTLTSMNSLGRVYLDTGQVDRALAIMEQVVDGRRRTLGVEHPHTLGSMSRLAHCYLLRGLVDRAFALHGEILAQRDTLAAKSPRTLGIVLSRYGAALSGVGRREEAEAVLVEAHELLKGATTTEPSDLRVNLDRLVELYEKWGRPERAAEWRNLSEP